jgi:nucleotide-binding universal stress UspA family protein
MTVANNILVATDFSELGQAAVAHALMLAEKLGSTLHVIHVYTMQNKPESASQTRDELERVEHQARAQLDGVSAELRSSQRLGQTVLRFGDPAPMILLTADELGVELIVMGTHGRRGLGRLVMGSVAEAVLRQSLVPVLIVKEHKAAKHDSAAEPARA